MTSKATFTYNNWLPGNPDNGYGGNENCLEINYQGHWNDAECKELKQYICEMEEEYVPYMGLVGIKPVFGSLRTTKAQTSQRILAV